MVLGPLTSAWLCCCQVTAHAYCLAIIVSVMALLTSYYFSCSTADLGVVNIASNKTI